MKIDKLKAKESEEALRIQSESKVMEKLINKRSLLLQKKEECMRKIRELGSLPASVAEYVFFAFPPPSFPLFSMNILLMQSYRYQSVPRKELLTNLNEVNRKLGAYNQVNKKAFDQYVSFSEQREGLIKRKEDLDKGAEVCSLSVNIFFCLMHILPPENSRVDSSLGQTEGRGHRKNLQGCSTSLPKGVFRACS